MDSSMEKNKVRGGRSGLVSQFFDKEVREDQRAGLGADRNGLVSQILEEKQRRRRGEWLECCPCRVQEHSRSLV